MNIVCDWQNDDAIQTVHNKKAVEADLFIYFLVYTVEVDLSVLKIISELGISMKRFVNDVAYS